MQNKKKWLVLAFLLFVMLGGGTFWWTQQRTITVQPVLPLKKPTPVAPLEDKKPQNTAARQDSMGIAVAPITEISPRTVYSGNLGTLTVIQAGADLRKVQLEIAQVDAKISELGRQELAQVALPALPPSPSPHGPEKTESSSPRIMVLSVCGMGNTLSATLRTKNGTHVVRTGEDVPGFGKVQHISRDRVVVGGAAIPWK
mgnify:FL=1